MPIAAWREARVFCGRGRPGAVFASSGTTSSRRGKHCFRDLAVYEASVVAGWDWARAEWARRGAAVGEKARFLALMASPGEAPGSSLSRMLGILARRAGEGPAFWALRGGRWDWPGLARRLRQAGAAGRGTVVFGTAFAWVGFLDWCAARGGRFRLGRTALAVETGGTKGRSREVSREGLHRAIAGTLGLPRGRVRSEYSMCELSSQAWSFGDRFAFPPWCRARVAPFLGGGGRRGRGAGVLEVADLANTDSCAFVRTEDLARAAGKGFRLAGRAPRAVAKGCSLEHERGARVRPA
jgi:hypothetical protein